MADDRSDITRVKVKPRPRYVTDIKTIGQILGKVLNTFPSYLLSNESVSLQMAPYLEQISRDYCSSIDQLSIIVEQDPSMQGSFGIVGPLYINTGPGANKLYVHGVSFQSYDGHRKCSNEHGCKWISHDVEVLVKSSKDPIRIFMEVRPSQSFPIYTAYESNDSLHESVVGGLASYLYDLGVAPCVSKQFGYYACLAKGHHPARYNTSLIVEKSSIPLIDVLGGIGTGPPGFADSLWQGSVGQKIFDDLSINDLIIWTCHLARTFFVMKYHFGISHFDSHLGNVLLTILTDQFKHDDDEVVFDIEGDLEKREPIEVAYGGKLVNTVDYISYALPNGKRMILENNHTLVKLIDFGLTTADFRSSTLNKTMPVKFVNHSVDYVMGYYYALSEESGYGDVDYNFFVYCVLFQLYKISHDVGSFGLSIAEREKAAILYDGYLTFAQATIDKDLLDLIITTDLQDDDVEYDIIAEMDNADDWTFSARNVGTTPNIDSPLNRIYTYLVDSGFAMDNGDVMVTRSGMIEDIDETSNVLGVGYQSDCSFDGTGFAGCPIESAFISRTKEYIQSCARGAVLNEGDRISCERLATQRIAADPNHVFSYPIASPDIIYNRTLWDHRRDRLRSNIKESDLNQYLVLNADPSLRMFKIDIPDLAIRTRKRSDQNYDKRHSLHLIYIDRESVAQLHYVSNTDEAYHVSSLVTRPSALMIGGWFNDGKPYGLLTINEKVIETPVIPSVQNVAVLSTGIGINFVLYRAGQRYPGAKYIFTSILAINGGEVVPARFAGSAIAGTRGLLGETTSGKILYVASEGDSINNSGLTADQMSQIGVHLGMRIAVHFSQGLITNSLVSFGEVTKWVMPSSSYSSGTRQKSIALFLSPT